MERFNTCDLREKDIINICNGNKVGRPSDFEFNLHDGKITALIITRSSGFLGLGKEMDIFIPWDKIECIGEDAILVRLPQGECYSPEFPRNRRNFW